MNYAQAETYMLGTIGEVISPRLPYRLERMRALMHALGDPQNAYPTVHVGGTSGKGSTSTLIAAILTADGKRVGLHTKPHLRSMTERARIDGVPVSEGRFAELLTEMMPTLEAVAGEHGRPTYYETLLALTFLYFARERVDAAVIEVGLGGRLDGTNVIVPRVSVITTVGYDHMDVLGNTLEEIASEKAGIAKAGVPLVSSVEDAGARRVIEEHCAQVGAPFVSVLDTTRIDPQASDAHHQRFTVETPTQRYELSLQLLGAFQRGNAATAIRALEEAPGLSAGRAVVERALAAVTLPGRMETFVGRPTVVFDVAHNAEKAAHLASALLEHFPGKRFRCVVAIGESKDAPEILRALHALPGSFVFTSFETPGRHAAKPQRLAAIAQSLGAWGRAIGDSVEALTVARRESGPDDVVVVTGSTFVVADLRAWWFEHVVAQPLAH